jgi:ABC-type transport system substrate-binding protein
MKKEILQTVRINRQDSRSERTFDTTGEDGDLMGRMTRRSFMKYAGAGALAGWASRSLPVGRAPSSAAAAPSTTLRVASFGDIAGLDPYDLVTNNNNYYYEVYDFLVNVTPDLKIVPWLAESYTLSKDAMSLTMKLRPNIKTHSGGLFDANAVKANLKRARTKETGSWMYTLLEAWDDIEVLDQRTFTVKFKAPNAGWFASATRWGLVDPAAFDTVRSKGGGTGPFSVQEWIPGDHLQMDRNPGYWNVRMPGVDRIVVKPYADPQAQLAALEANATDTAVTIAARDASRLQKSGYQIVLAPPTGDIYCFVVNGLKEPFTNKLVRQAFMHVIDRQTIVKSVLFGYSAPIVQPVAPKAPVYDASLTAKFGFDLKKAKDMITAAGYPNGFRFEALLASDMAIEMPEIAQIMQADLRKIGIQMDLQQTDTSRFFASQYGKGNFTAAWNFYGCASVDPSKILSASAYRINATNPCWMNQGPPKAYLDSMNKAISALTMQDRWAEFRNTVHALLEDPWVYQIALRQSVYAARKNITGLAVDAYGVVDFRRVRFTG